MSRRVRRLGTAARRAVGRLVERVAAPALAPLRADVGALTARVDKLVAPPTPLYGSFHDLLHAQRSVELSRMPRPARVLLSAGCSGAWYFEWIARWYGPVDHHVGIERYLPPPDVLPAGVEWIPSSVADMPEVRDATVDLAFSGQNVEHLFGEDVVGFLLECARVVRPGGHLVMDSPHREIADLLDWSMAEHTIEYTPAEASELVTLAGFDPTSLRGVWLCREPDSGAVLPLDPYAVQASPDEIVRRIQLAARYPEHAFVWWLEARRSARAPQRDALRRRHADIFAAAWPRRCRRFQSEVGTRRDDDGRRVVSAPADVVGYLLYGPYFPFSAGRYDVTFALRRGDAALPDDAVVAVVDAYAEGGDAPCLARREVRARELRPGRWTDVQLGFDVPELRWTGQLRVYSTGVDALAADTAVVVDDLSTPVWPPLARAAATRQRDVG